MKALLDRIDWIAFYMRATPEQNAADAECVKSGFTKVSHRDVAFQCLDEIRVIAEMLPDTVHLVAEAPAGFVKTVQSLGDARKPPERVIDLPGK